MLDSQLDDILEFIGVVSFFFDDFFVDKIGEGKFAVFFGAEAGHYGYEIVVCLDFRLVINPIFKNLKNINLLEHQLTTLGNNR